MKKTKEYLVQGVAIAIVVLSIFFGEYLLFVKEGFVGLWIVLTLYLGFIKTPTAGEMQIYLTTQNDSSFAHQRLIVGFAIILGGSAYYYFENTISLFLSLLMIQAALLIFLNFYKKRETKGLFIKIKDEKLLFTIGKTHKSMTLEEIQEIAIKSTEIIISRDLKKKNYISFLDLSDDEIKELSQFLRSSKPEIKLTVEN